MLGTFQNDNTKEIEDQNIRKIKPIVWCDYNNTMAGVDLSAVFYCRIPAPKSD